MDSILVKAARYQRNASTGVAHSVDMLAVGEEQDLCPDPTPFP